MNAKQAIDNLTNLSSVMDKVANSSTYYNTEYGYYLEQMSHALYKHANELKEMQGVFGSWMEV